MEILQEGPKLIPMFDYCGMYNPAARLPKHRRTERCNNATEMRIRQRDVEMAERCRETGSILYRGEENALLVEVETFK